MVAKFAAKLMDPSQRGVVIAGMMVLMMTATVVQIIKDPQNNSHKAQWDWMNNTPNTRQVNQK